MLWYVAYPLDFGWFVFGVWFQFRHGLGVYVKVWVRYELYRIRRWGGVLEDSRLRGNDGNEVLE